MQEERDEWLDWQPDPSSDEIQRIVDCLDAASPGANLFAFERALRVLERAGPCLRGVQEDERDDLLRAICRLRTVGRLHLCDVQLRSRFDLAMHAAFALVLHWHGSATLPDGIADDCRGHLRIGRNTLHSARLESEIFERAAQRATTDHPTVVWPAR